MRMSQFFIWMPLWCILTLVVSIPARAALELFVEEPLYVYSKPRPSAKRIFRLLPGKQVLISSKIYGSWRKVLIQAGSNRRVGFVRVRDLVKSTIKKQGVEPPRQAYGQSSGLGVSLVSSFMQQGRRSISTTSEDIFEVGDMSSLSNFFLLFYDTPVDEERAVFRISLGLRQTQFQGETRLTSSSAASPVKVEQQLLSLGFTGRFYSALFSSLWWGVGTELSRGASVTVTLNGEALEREEKPFFCLLSLDAGWDWHLASDLYFLPSLRVGGVVNTQPVIPTAELLLSLGYKL